MKRTDWEIHKPEIERLYVRQDRSLKDVMEILAKRRGFLKSKKQYENAFNAWGFRKYKMTPRKWKIISRKVKRRKRETGKDSEVYIDGQRYPSSQLQVGILRHGFLSEAEMYSVPSPELPEGIVVCSPLPATVFKWPPSLPWFQFLRQISQGGMISRDSVSTTMVSMNYHQFPFSTDHMIPILGVVIPLYAKKKVLKMSNSIRLQDFLKVIMPTEYAEEHQPWSEILCGNRKDMTLQERFQLLFYLLSNNLRLDQEGKLGYNDRHRAFMYTEDELIMDILRSSGLATIDNMKHLLANPGLTMRSIAQKLFQSAVRSCDIELTRILLKSGIPSNILIPDCDGRNWTALEYLVKHTPGSISVELVDLFISQGADINEYQQYPILFSLVFEEFRFNESIVGGRFELAQALLSRGAKITACLETVQLRATSEYDSFYQRHELKIFLRSLPLEELNIDDLEAFFRAILRISVTGCDLELMDMVLGWGADVNLLHKVPLGADTLQTTALGLAAESGNMDVLQALYMAGASVNLADTKDPNIVPPLTLAVTHGNLDAVKFLACCSGDINTENYFSGCKRTLFDLALEKRDMEMCGFLLSAGAMVKEDLLRGFHILRLCTVIKENDVISLLQLPLWQIDLNAILLGDTRTCLGMAIEQGRHQMVELLVNSGATNVGISLSRIGGVETGMYLDSVGLLHGIMASYGHNILTEAIINDDDALVKYLLHATAVHIAEITTIPVKNLTALSAAMEKKNLAVFNSLLTHGAHIAECDLNVALYRALRTTDHTFLRPMLCLRSPVGLNAAGALCIAASWKKHMLVKLLLDFGVDPTGQSMTFRKTVLQCSAEQDDDDIFYTILKSAQWSKKHLGEAFTCSVRENYISRMRYLYDSGAYLNESITISGTPLSIAVEREDVPLIKTLLNYGCDPNTAADFADLPLEVAAKLGNIDIVNLLLDAGAELDTVPFSQFLSPLQIAVRDGNMKLFETLLAADADVNGAPSPHGGATALQFAAIRGFIGIARILLEEGADVNAGRAATNGRTALEGAAEHGRIDMLHLLLDHGTLIEGRGRTQYIRAVFLAEQNAHSAIANFLRSYGTWTSSDSERYDLEKGKFENGQFFDKEPDYENDLFWNYSPS